MSKIIQIKDYEDHLIMIDPSLVMGVVISPDNYYEYKNGKGPSSIWESLQGPKQVEAWKLEISGGGESLKIRFKDSEEAEKIYKQILKAKSGTEE